MINRGDLTGCPFVLSINNIIPDFFPHKAKVINLLEFTSHVDCLGRGNLQLYVERCLQCDQGHLEKTDQSDYRKISIHSEKVGCGPISSFQKNNKLLQAQNFNIDNERFSRKQNVSEIMLFYSKFYMYHPGPKLLFCHLPAPSLLFLRFAITTRSSLFKHGIPFIKMLFQRAVQNITVKLQLVLSLQ